MSHVHQEGASDHMLILAAVLPALVLLAVVYAADRHKERPRRVLPLFVVGALVVLPAGLCERYLLDLYAATPNPPTGFVASLVTAFFVAGITEEAFKGFAFLRLVYHRPIFSEMYDGVLYAVAISLGFAAVENILYVTSDGLQTAFVRAFTAVPAHGLFGVAMGSYFGKAKFSSAPLWPAFAVPALLHGAYDAFALAHGFWANIALIGYLMWLVRFSWIKAATARVSDRFEGHRTS